MWFVLIPYFDRLLEPNKGYYFLKEIKKSASPPRSYYVGEASTL